MAQKMILKSKKKAVISSEMTAFEKQHPQPSFPPEKVDEKKRRSDKTVKETEGGGLAERRKTRLGSRFFGCGDAYFLFCWAGNCLIINDLRRESESKVNVGFCFAKSWPKRYHSFSETLFLKKRLFQFVSLWYSIRFASITQKANFFFRVTTRRLFELDFLEPHA